ncbi:MAG: alpha-L-rhamnosidase family protein [Chthoniobacteraceae bacterium]|nr:alpha-L-rhamnosidase family protein [Chthoniobacteraceae bacterium]
MTSLLPSSFWRGIFVLLGFTLSAANAGTVRTQANVMVEIPFTASRVYHDPSNEVTLDVTFTDPAGHELCVPAFWAGKNIWKVRYASPVTGLHTFKTEYADASETGLHHIAGNVQVEAYTGLNPLYLHGPLRVAASRRYLEHLDGKPFFWLGDTWWMGLCQRLQWPAEFKTLAADRKEKGFTVVQIVAGLYPDMPPFDPRGANEAGFPWEKDYARIRPEYFDAADQRLAHLVESGLTPCIVGAWGYFLPMMGVEKATLHWRNLVARYGAMPVVWCVAGEANLPYYQAKGFPYDDRVQVKGWTEVTRSLRAMDPFKRPITIHPTGIGRLSARNAIDDINLIDIDMLQTPHGEAEAVPPTVQTVRQSYADHPVLPVINGEASYEMLNGKIPAQWPRAMFWVCMLNGAGGHTYGANGIWQCNRKDQPHGPSPTAGSPPTGYGTIPWDEAMNLPGSKQIALGKRLLEQFPWHQFTPHPEWAGFAQAAQVNFDGAQWIWFPEGKPPQDAPVEKRFFRKTFVVDRGSKMLEARLRLSADDRFTVSLNGHSLGGAADWHGGKQFSVASLLAPGSNVLTVVAENLPAPVPANPAGLIASLEIRFASGELLKLSSDTTWRCAKSGAADWESLAFDDAKWSAAMSVGAYGDAPWGRFDQPAANDLAGPQSAGIPGGVRVIYLPRGEPVTVRGLEANGKWDAFWFNPVSGERTDLPTVGADAAGTWSCQPPVEHDWVLILNPAKPDASKKAG